MYGVQSSCVCFIVVCLLGFVVVTFTLWLALWLAVLACSSSHC